MKPTKHATTNYKMLKPFLDGLNGGDHRRYYSGEYMPLVVEKLYEDGAATVYSLTHYGEQNGDAMRDPDMELRIDHDAGTVEPLTFRNDYMGIFDQVYITRNGQKLYSPRLRTDLDCFLWQWLKNIQDQGFLKNI
ncbi:MAG: DUF1249 domain-containing protein [Oscillospiraceae bacterium]|nr:DUF1249 domain-containing protein [Oscillospiraceae bacterium]